MAASTVAITFLSFGVWMHHMFATGLGFSVLYVFALSSLLIAVPTGIKVWNWIATMWGGTIRFTTAMLFATAFVIQFTIGGLSGVTFAVIPIDWQLTDSYFVVAHIHYVLLGGMMFAMLSGIYYWFPKVTGRMLSEKIGKWHFWLMVLGFNGTFLSCTLWAFLGCPGEYGPFHMDNRCSPLLICFPACHPIYWLHLSRFSFGIFLQLFERHHCR